MLIAAVNPLLVFIPSLLIGIGGLGTGVAALWTRKDTHENQEGERRVDYQSRLLAALQSHVDYLSKREAAREERIDHLMQDLDERDRKIRDMQRQIFQLQSRLATLEGPNS